MSERLQQNCHHHQENGIEAIQLLNGFPDRKPRGICIICREWIDPKEWREDPNKPPYVHPAHKDYDRVIALWDARS